VELNGVESSARSIIVINVGGDHKSWLLTLPGKNEGATWVAEGDAFVIAIKS